MGTLINIMVLAGNCSIFSVSLAVICEVSVFSQIMFVHQRLRNRSNPRINLFSKICHLGNFF